MRPCAGATVSSRNTSSDSLDFIRRSMAASRLDYDFTPSLLKAYPERPRDEAASVFGFPSCFDKLSMRVIDLVPVKG